jgi:MFS family permease
MINTSGPLTSTQVRTGLKRMIHDGLATEAMSCLTEGTFLVALALQLGATNFQIGLLGALPTFTNIFQLAAIWLVQRAKTRRLVTVVALAVARAPLFIVGVLPFWLSNDVALHVLTVLMFVHYLFGSVAGASWNSWAKDLIPGRQLGRYFSERTRLTQTLNVVLSLSLAFATSYIGEHYPALKPSMFPFLFILGGVAGMISVVALARAPEPRMVVTNTNIMRMFANVASDKNFRKLLSFNSFWVFALNLVSPFFSVYMMKTLGLQVPAILCLTVLGQVCGIFIVRLWGKNADKYGNKTVIGICIPIYIVCLLAWVGAGSLGGSLWLWPVLGAIHIFTSVATAGINLSLTNIGLKLSPSGGAMAYLAAKNMFTSIFSAAAPLIAGLLADSYVTGFRLFFIAAAVFASFSLYLLRRVDEEGATKRRVLVKNIRMQINGAFDLKRKKAA